MFYQTRTIIGKTIEYIDHGHCNLLMYELLTSTDNVYESGFVTDQVERNCQLKGDHEAAQIRYMNMMIKLNDLFGFINCLEKIIYGRGFRLILKRSSNDRSLFWVYAGAGAVDYDCNIEIRKKNYCKNCILY